MSTAPERQAIRVEYDLAQPPRKVWRALTESDLLGRWLMPNDIKAQVGHRFTFKTAPALGFDGVVHCKVLEVVEPRARNRPSGAVPPPLAPCSERRRRTPEREPF